jgi:hypothetical protein
MWAIRKQNATNHECPVPTWLRHGLIFLFTENGTLHRRIRLLYLGCRVQGFGEPFWMKCLSNSVTRNLIDAYEKIKSRPDNMSGQWAGWNFGWRISIEVALIIHCAVLKIECTSSGQLNMLWFPSPKNLMKRDL